jgi:plasmid stability protein
MGTLLIRNVSEETLTGLKARAAERGTSVQAEVITILDHAVLPAGLRLMRLMPQDGKRMWTDEEYQGVIESIREDRER